LLVEDSMIIALDSEDALRALGATSVAVASTSAQARAVLARGTVDGAVLDFNLGGETSIGIADALLEASIPFVFATGYGDQIDLPERFAEVAVIRKPYTADDLAEAVARSGMAKAPD
jgi:CheY-like chemotaxis protein